MVRLRRITKLGFLFLFLSVFWACPDEGNNLDLIITIENNSPDDIISYTYNSNPLDTSLIEKFPWYHIEDVIIKKNTQSKKAYSSELLRDLFANGGWEHYYLFNYDTVKNVQWNRIKEEYIVAKRIDFNNWEDMKICNFTITYP
ncbi:MAG: hypothetical protein GQ564_18215 [Bacteroidales bacterium]|nr:hypothetical protein [Bacteroidales bacterium]